jgi:hypothetical protein
MLRDLKKYIKKIKGKETKKISKWNENQIRKEWSK